MIDQVLDQSGSALMTMTRRISCNFVDARTTSKDYVRTAATLHSEPIGDFARQHHFLISTCLRHEIYCFDGSQTPREPFLYASGLTCVRRLLAILVGLQSEIIGEQEISSQVAKAIDEARDARLLDENTILSLHALLSLAVEIRSRSEITTSENYSTIAADLVVEQLAAKPGAAVAIIGGGYMAERFFSSLLKARFVNISRLTWVNRTTAKLQESLSLLIDLIDIDVEIIGLDEGRHALHDVDAVFCALSKAELLYKLVGRKSGAFIVDVSYPPVFDEAEDTTLLNISNTHFDRLVRRPASKASIARANAEIDAVLDFLQRGL